VKPTYLWLPVAFALFQAFWCLHFNDAPVTNATYTIVWAWLAILGAWTLQILRDQAKHVRSLEERLARVQKTQ
jgi:hypothetical protein